MDTECFALHNLKKKFSLEASCDISPAMEMFSAYNHQPKMWFDDVTSDDFKTRAPACDLILVSFGSRDLSRLRLRFLRVRFKSRRVEIAIFMFFCDLKGPRF